MILFITFWDKVDTIILNLVKRKDFQIDNRVLNAIEIHDFLGNTFVLIKTNIARIAIAFQVTH